LLRKVNEEKGKIGKEQRIKKLTKGQKGKGRSGKRREEKKVENKP